MSAATINPQANHPAYHADYLALAEQLTPHRPDWLRELRAAAWERFDTLGFPTARRGNERWKYTNVRPIAQAEFGLGAADGNGRPDLTAGFDVKPPFPDFPAPWLNLVFVDGVPLAGPQMGDGAVSTLADALAAGNGIAEAVRANLARHAAFDDDPFVALNTAFLNDGACVRLPDDSPETVFLNIAYLRQNAATVAYPRTLIVAGRNTRLTVFESYLDANALVDGGNGAGNQSGVSEGAPRYFTNAVTEIALAEGAQVSHYRLLDESRNAFHVGTTRVTQARDSSYTSGSFARGMALGRHDLSVLLDGTGAFCSLNGLYLTDDTQHMDNLVSIDHAKPHGISRLYYKGILDGRSKAVFGGTVLVREDAQKTDAQQTDKNLILSDRAEVDSKPSLLIYADDVKCGHGATAGHIDADTLFYMRSRGLDPETASRILIHAFASEIIDSVAQPEVRDYLDALFLDTVSGKTLPNLGESGAASGNKSGTGSGSKNPGPGRRLGGD